MVSYLLRLAHPYCNAACIIEVLVHEIGEGLLCYHSPCSVYVACNTDNMNFHKMVEDVGMA